MKTFDRRPICMIPVDDVAERSRPSSSGWGRLEPFVSLSREWLRSATDSLAEGLYRGGWRRHASDRLMNARVVWALGQSYVPPSTHDLECALRELVWFTYRRGFPPLPSSNQCVTADCGWGCMLRVAQMMVARALAVSVMPVGEEPSQFARQIIRHFEDTPHSVLGIHALVELAERRFDWKEPVGRWYTPSETILLLREALLSWHRTQQSCSPSLRMNIYVPFDNTVILSEIVALSSGWSRGVLIAIPLRLGTKHINPIYYPKLKAAFTLSTAVGIIGGRPKHALYLIGYADDVNLGNFQPSDRETPIQNLFGLDPHTTQEYRRLETVDSGDSHWNTFRTTTAAVMAISRMDPSCAIGFLVRSEHEYIEWRRAMNESGLATDNSTSDGSSSTPLFTIMETRVEFTDEGERDLCKDNPSLGDFEIL